MRRTIKSIFILISTLCLSCLLTGCTTDEPKNSYIIDEIYEDEAYGFYVRNGENYIPVTKVESDNDLYAWVAGGLKCPTVDKEHPLVAIYHGNDSMPNEYYINKYENKGWTVGGNFTIKNGRVYLNTESPCKGSDVADVADRIDLDQEVEIQSILGEDPPISNIDTEINIMYGFEKNKTYEFALYTGTDIEQGQFTADTEVFKLTGRTDFSEPPLKRTTNRYFEVILPENLEEGYYRINDIGFFYYAG